MTTTQVRGGQVLDGSLTDLDVAAANKDGTAATPSIRTIGTGAQQAAPGNATGLSVFVASGSGHSAGIVPDPGSSAGTTKFLREDATFAVPASGAAPVIVAAGASHAGGSVPDPGSTTHTPAYFLGDDAAWHDQVIFVHIAGVETITGAKTFSGGISSVPPGSGTTNEAFGASALAANTTGSGNTAVGSTALTTNTTGGSNVAVGQNALGVNTTGNSNVAIGQGALAANTTATGNMAIGATALTVNTTGYSNVAVGNSSLSANTTGYSNVALGGNAMLLNTTGFGNVAVGGSCLYLNTTGFANTVLGSTALYLNSTGFANTAIGYQVLYACTGNYNMGAGYNTFRNLTSGANNVAVGSDGGTTNPLTTGSYNTLLGDSAAVASASQTYGTALGYAAVAAANECALSPYANVLTGYVLSSTSMLRARADWTFVNVSNTDASRKYRIVGNVWDTAAREWIRAEATGSKALVGIGGAVDANELLLVNGCAKVVRLAGGSAAPTVVKGTGAGTNATVSVVGTDTSGTITVNTSALDTPAGNATIVTLTFNTTYTSAPVVIIMPSNDAASNLAYGILRCRQGDVTTTTFTIRSGTTPLTALTAATYTINYHVIQ